MDQPFALIVEDDRDIAALFRHVLDIAGYRTEIALQGRDALDRLKSGRPDIVLLDLHLPGIPGAKILELIRADQRLKDMPVVVVTAHSQSADSLPVEPDLVLLKPVNLGQLSNLVQRLRQTAQTRGESPWDPITHLYNSSFFALRLKFAIEREREPDANPFGVMFIDLEPFSELGASLAPEKLEIFLREIAGNLKTNLRPTDTVSRADGGLFLVLVEDIPDYATPSSIAARIDLRLADLIAARDLPNGLQARVGLMLCTADYASVPEVLGDVEIARRLSGSGQARSSYDRDMLRRLRGTKWSDSSLVR